MRCEMEMRVYATVFLVVCCFLCLPCVGEEPKASNASSLSIGTTFIDGCDSVVYYFPAPSAYFLKSFDPYFLLALYISHSYLNM